MCRLTLIILYRFVNKRFCHILVMSQHSTQGTWGCILAVLFIIMDYCHNFSQLHNTLIERWKINAFFVFPDLAIHHKLVMNCESALMGFLYCNTRLKCLNKYAFSLPKDLWSILDTRIMLHEETSSHMCTFTLHCSTFARETGKWKSTIWLNMVLHKSLLCGLLMMVHILEVMIVHSLFVTS